MTKIKILAQTESGEADGYDYVLQFLDKNRRLNFGVASVIEQIKTAGGIISDHGLDFLFLGLVVYFTDKHVSRNKNSQDSWTRELSLKVSVWDIELWNLSKQEIVLMLNFLTGDIWDIEFTRRTTNIEDIIGLQNINMIEREVEVISLFSGGMDSLISTINYLSNDKQMLLISHASDPTTKSSQKKVLAKLTDFYGDGRLNQISLWTDFTSINPSEKEKTTRSRSFLFISLAVFTAQSFVDVKNIEIPENGLIALNIPLDSLRVGAYTTRTTHPYYLSLWNKVLSDHNFHFMMNNSYWNKTKGEMALECANRELLAETLPLSNSCSSSSKARYSHMSPDTHCGHCVPCIVRRAAVYKGFPNQNDRTEYAHNIPGLLATNNKKGLQLRSFLYAINRIKEKPLASKVLIHGTGSIKGESDYLLQLANVYSRGLLEIETFVNKFGEQQ